MRHDVFRAHQQLLHGAAQSALQQNRPAAFSERFQQHEILHVARADLQHVCIVRHEIDVAVAHHFCHDSQPRRFFRLLQQLQSFFFHPLKIVWRRARLERTAAQQLRARLRDTFCRTQNLFFRFDRTRSCDHNEFVAANYRSVHANLRLLFAELLADEFVRRADAHYVLDLRHSFDGFHACRHVADSDHTDYHALFALNRMHFVSEVIHLVRHRINLLARCVPFHRDDHRHSLSRAAAQ